ncbi:MAG: serine/threonine protein kinase [Verrucomicrobiales bacterium]|jgi:serine/threonine protein kinase
MSAALDASVGDADVDTAMPEGSGASASDPDRHLRSDLLEGTTVGPTGRYKILQQLGEGGFGIVYMAEQTAPVRRRVALKILKAGMDTRQVVTRFEAERQALAMMDHPNIAKILDGGETDQGRPFFVMELVRGTPITAYCDREQLDTGARLELFRKVCQAVQHAHQKGIIHRDLKPSNILITAPDGAEPVPKVIDFGVAKAMENNLTDKTLFTRFEQMIGTPAYMSPEQAGSEGGVDVDTRSDIYALGVLLYELLTGTTPIEANTLQKAAFDEVRRLLNEDEAPRPSARLSSLEAERRSTIARERGTEAGGLSKLLRGELDWIVMKAIEKDRRRRYETANALALDVERHLADEPVSAGPPTAAYRTGKFLRRHKAPLAVAAALILLLLAGITATSWQAIRATAEQRRTAAEKDRALGAEEIAEERRKEAEAISDFLSSMFESAQPGAEGGGRRAEGGGRRAHDHPHRIDQDC